MNHDEVTERVGEISRKVAASEGLTDTDFVMQVYARVCAEAPEVIDYLTQERPGSDPYQQLKWFIPDDLGFRIS